MKTIEYNDSSLSLLSNEDLTTISGGTVAKDVGTVIGYAAGYFLGGVIVLGMILLSDKA